MADIELVVKLSEEDYKNCVKYDALTSSIYKAIQRGIPLPKGHGRLIDESKIKKCGWNYIHHNIKTDAPTIIEADRESEVDNGNDD